MSQLISVANEVKQIENFPDYLVTSQGTIYSIKSKKFLAQFQNNCGYYFVYLSKEGQTYKFFVSRLVAKAFHKNPSNLPEVNHMDGDKSNNYKTNLEWVTRSQNMLHAKQNGLWKHRMLKVINIDTQEVFKSITEAASKIGYSISHLSRILNGKSNNHTNYRLLSETNQE